MTQESAPNLLHARDGTPLAFSVRPAAADAPVIALVHSLGMDHRFWDPVAQGLAGQATVVTVDARGHGRSGRGQAPLSAQGMAEDLLDVLDHLEVSKAVVGGASMGGCVALQFAGSYPQRTQGLALIDTTAWYGPTAPKDWEDRALHAQAKGLASMVDFQKTRWFSDGFRATEPHIVQASVETFLANDLQGYMGACRMLGAFDGRALLAHIRVPTWVLVGEEDYAAPVAMAQLMHEGIVGSQMQVIQGARHLTPLEVPDRVAAALIDLCLQVTR
ncbi:MAG: alpha/beta fold hydrolase [Betaproteobacteria bacterium]